MSARPRGLAEGSANSTVRWYKYIWWTVSSATQSLYTFIVQLLRPSAKILPAIYQSII